MAKKEDQAVATQEAQFPALTQGAGVLEALRENLGGSDLSPFDLDRVSIPTGGGVAWMVPNLEGNVDSLKDLTGIIMGAQLCRAFWYVSFEESGGGSPPDCVSEDSVTGVGDPGGACAVCPNAEFGSKAGRQGQACKQIFRLFLLRPESMLPMVVNLPPTSLKGARKYLLRLAGQGMKMHSVVTRITLEQDKSKADKAGKGGGITYSKAAFAMVGKLTPEQVGQAAAYAKALAPAFKRVSAEDFTGEKIPFETNPGDETSFQ